ncbi:MAG: rhodanese-like domain-containing protein, partial [Caldimicrobium sp.]
MKKKVLLALTGALLLTSSSAFAVCQGEECKIVQKVAERYLSGLPDHAHHITADEVYKRIQSGDKNFVIVDVRMPKAEKYDKGHLPGAIYIGWREIAKPENLAKLPKDKDIIIYCDTGHEQMRVASILRMLGYNVYTMRFGMMSWKVLPPTSRALDAISGSIKN